MDAILKFHHALNVTAQGPCCCFPSVAQILRQPAASRFYNDHDWYNTKGRCQDGRHRAPIIIDIPYADGGRSGSLFFTRLPLVVDELGRLVETDPRARELVSARIASIIGDLAIISHCIGQLELYIPWARSFETTMLDRRGAIETDFAIR